MIGYYLIFFPFFCLVLAFCFGIYALANLTKQFPVTCMIFFVVLAVINFVISISALGYDGYCGSTTANLGVGKVVRLNNSVSGKQTVITTYTVVNLDGINYTCYGYVPDAKEVSVIETKRIFTGLCSYVCELPL
jgi:Na+/H+-dicarboxylate symporter